VPGVGIVTGIDIRVQLPEKYKENFNVSSEGPSCILRSSPCIFSRVFAFAFVQSGFLFHFFCCAEVRADSTNFKS
jgi:hypothetical protein